MTTEVRGIGGNEFKSRLIKRGYDIYCPNPECRHHWGQAESRLRVRCPKCGHVWRVDSTGRPLLGGADEGH